MLRWPIFFILPFWGFITALDDHLNYWNFWDLNISLDINNHKTHLVIEKDLFGIPMPTEVLILPPPHETHLIADEKYLFLHAKEQVGREAGNSMRIFFYLNTIDIKIKNTHLEEILLGPGKVFYQCRASDELLSTLISKFEKTQSLNLKCEVYKKVGHVSSFESMPYGFPTF